MKFSMQDLQAQANTLFESGFSTGAPHFSPISDYTIFPGFFDVHVHFREPGFSYKETIKTGSLAGAHGGYTGVCPMPNLKPVPDSLEHLKEEQDIIDRDACIDVLPYASITVGEEGKQVVDMEALADHIFAFSDDGHGVQDGDKMEEAMRRAAALNKIIAAHCEVNSLLHGGYINDGEYCKAHGHRGICNESEWGEIKRDAELAEKTGCAFHVCHVSTKESVQVIREAKSRGVDITCETGPHYLVLDDTMLQEDGCFKMNPPLRSPEDRKALVEGILDGTIAMIATDHAPHSAEEKSRGLERSPFGITGLETAFPVAYTGLVKTGILTLDKLIDLMAVAPRRRFGIPLEPDCFTVFDLNDTYKVDPDTFLSMGKSTPFAGETVSGRCLLTVCHGNVVWKHPSVELTD